MLSQFGKDIWVAQGQPLSVLGFTYPTSSTIIRLTDGQLVIVSPVTLSKALKQAVDALGRVAWLVAPNAFHHMFLGEWQSAYPKAQLLGLAALQKKRPDLRFAGTLEAGEAVTWGGAINQILLKNRLTDEVVFFHHASRTVIFTDIIQQFPADWHKGWRKIIARLDLMVGARPQVPRKFRLGFSDRDKTRSAVQSILEWPIEHVLMAHGAPVHKNGHTVLQNTFAWLIR